MATTINATATLSANSATTSLLTPPPPPPPLPQGELGSVIGTLRETTSDGLLQQFLRTHQLFQKQSSWRKEAHDRWRVLDEHIGADTLNHIDLAVTAYIEQHTHSRNTANKPPAKGKMPGEDTLQRLRQVSSTQWQLRPYQLIRDLSCGVLTARSLRALRRIATTLVDAQGHIIPWLDVVNAIVQARGTVPRDFQPRDIANAETELLQLDPPMYFERLEQPQAQNHTSKRKASNASSSRGADDMDPTSDNGSDDVTSAGGEMKELKPLRAQPRMPITSRRKSRRRTSDIEQSISQEPLEGDTLVVDDADSGLAFDSPQPVKPDIDRQMNHHLHDTYDSDESVPDHVQDFPLNEATPSQDVVAGIAPTLSNVNWPPSAQPSHQLTPTLKTSATAALLLENYRLGHESGLATLPTTHSSHSLSVNPDVPTAALTEFPQNSTHSQSRRVSDHPKAATRAIEKPRTRTLDSPTVATPPYVDEPTSKFTTTGRTQPNLPACTSTSTAPFQAAPVPPLRLAATNNFSQEASMMPGSISRASTAPPMHGAATVAELLAVNTNRRQTVPGCDAAGQASSLKPGNWVSASAISSFLGMCNPDSSRFSVKDSGYLDISDLHHSLDAGRRFHRKSQQSTIYIPINLGDAHWVIGIVDRTANTYEIYDSLPSLNLSHALASLQHFQSMCAPRMKQTNRHDCGVYIVARATMHMHQHVCPSSIIPEVWRRAMLACIADDGADGDPFTPRWCTEALLEALGRPLALNTDAAGHLILEQQPSASLAMVKQAHTLQLYLAQLEGETRFVMEMMTSNLSLQAAEQALVYFQDERNRVPDDLHSTWKDTHLSQLDSSIRKAKSVKSNLEGKEQARESARLALEADAQAYQRLCQSAQGAALEIARGARDAAERAELQAIAEREEAEAILRSLNRTGGT